MRDPVAFQRRGHLRYGPMFSTDVFGQPLTFVDPVGAPELFEQVVRAPSDQLSINEAYKQLVGRIIGPELFVELSREIRTGLSNAYIKQHIAGTERFARQAMARRLPAEGGTIDALTFCNDLVLEILAHYLVGAEITARSGDEIARLMHVLESDYSVVGMMLPIETPSAKRRRAAFDRLLELFEAEIQRRLDDGAEHDDFMQYIIDNAPVEPGAARPDSRRLGLQAMGAVFGAHTNTAMSTATALLDLLEHPAQMRQVLDELDALPSDATFDLPTLRALPHLFRSITETLRLRSTGGIWRKTLRPMWLGGYRLPAHTIIGASMGLVNLDPGRYEDPRAYRPSRYLAMKTDAYQSPPVGSTPLQFGAFGTGRSLCSGRPLSYTILGITLGRLLRDYRWTLVSKPRRWFGMLTAGLMRPVGSLTLRVQPRR